MRLWAWVLTETNRKDEIIRLPGAAYPLVSQDKQDMLDCQPAVMDYCRLRGRPVRLAEFEEQPKARSIMDTLG